MFLEQFLELRNNRGRHERHDPWFRITPEPERDPASERYCAECGRDLSGWKPAHSIEGVRGVFGTGCWIERNDVRYESGDGVILLRDHGIGDKQIAAGESGIVVRLGSSGWRR
jgi:hypothetical protein